MNGLTIISAKSGKLLYHKAFTKGWGVQEEYIDPLILGGVFYTLWCSSVDLCVENLTVRKDREDAEKSLDLVFPEKETRLHFAESNEAIWVISMKSIISSETARHILDEAMKNWESIKDAENNGISDETLGKPEMILIKHNFMDILRNFGKELLDDIFRQDEGMECLVVWGPPFFRGGFEDLIAIPTKKSIFNCFACMRIKEEPTPKYKTVYLDCENSPTYNSQSKFIRLVEQRIMPTLDFEQLLRYSREPGCHYTSQANIPKEKKMKENLYYIVIGDLLLFLGLQETRDINCILSKNWSDIQELEAIMNFSMEHSTGTSNVSTR